MPVSRHTDQEGANRSRHTDTGLAIKGHPAHPELTIARRAGGRTAIGMNPGATPSEVPYLERRAIVVGTVDVTRGDIVAHLVTGSGVRLTTGCCGIYMTLGAHVIEVHQEGLVLPAVWNCYMTEVTTKIPSHPVDVEGMKIVERLSATATSATTTTHTAAGCSPKTAILV